MLSGPVDVGDTGDGVPEVHASLPLGIRRVRRIRSVFIRKVLFPVIFVGAIDMVEKKIFEEEVVK